MTPTGWSLFGVFLDCVVISIWIFNREKPINIHWPYVPGNCYAPWYVITRRFAAFPFLILAKCLMWVALLIGWGLSDANENWRHI